MFIEVPVTLELFAQDLRGESRQPGNLEICRSLDIKEAQKNG